MSERHRPGRSPACEDVRDDAAPAGSPSWPFSGSWPRVSRRPPRRRRPSASRLEQGNECDSRDSGSAEAPPLPVVTLGNPISLVTGAKRQRETDFALDGAPLAFHRHSDSSNSDVDVGLGPGWRHTLAVALFSRPDGGLEILESSERRVLFDRATHARGVQADDSVDGTASTSGADDGALVVDGIGLDAADEVAAAPSEATKPLHAIASTPTSRPTGSSSRRAVVTSGTSATDAPCASGAASSCASTGQLPHRSQVTRRASSHCATGTADVHGVKER